VARGAVAHCGVCRMGLTKGDRGGGEVGGFEAAAEPEWGGEFLGREDRDLRSGVWDRVWKRVAVDRRGTAWIRAVSW
jgi:hypothetical protein